MINCTSSSMHSTSPVGTENQHQNKLLNLAIMSRNEAEEDARLYECVRKYQIIIKQFGELNEMMATRSRPQKRRKSTKLNGNPPGPSAPSELPENNDEFVQKITRFLHELRSSSPTSDPDQNQG